MSNSNLIQRVRPDMTEQEGECSSQTNLAEGSDSLQKVADAVSAPVVTKKANIAGKAKTDEKTMVVASSCTMQQQRSSSSDANQCTAPAANTVMDGSFQTKMNPPQSSAPLLEIATSPRSSPPSMVHTTVTGDGQSHQPVPIRNPTPLKEGQTKNIPSVTNLSATTPPLQHAPPAITQATSTTTAALVHTNSLQSTRNTPMSTAKQPSKTQTSQIKASIILPSNGPQQFAHGPDGKRQHQHQSLPLPHVATTAAKAASAAVAAAIAASSSSRRRDLCASVEGKCSRCH